MEFTASNIKAIRIIGHLMNNNSLSTQKIAVAAALRIPRVEAIRSGKVPIGHLTPLEKRSFCHAYQVLKD